MDNEKIKAAKGFNKLSSSYYPHGEKTYNRYNNNFRESKNSHEIIATEMLNKIRDIRRYESIIY